VRPIQSSRTTVHLHLCICLFVGSAIFLAGIENDGGGQVRPRPLRPAARGPAHPRPSLGRTRAAPPPPGIRLRPPQ
jgi:hypothetical protein